MTSRPSPDDAETDIEATIRARLSDLCVVLVALAVLLSFFGAAVTGLAAAMLAGGDAAAVDEAPATYFPSGIGMRETFGRTVLVGTTYLLGHWV